MQLQGRRGPAGPLNGEPHDFATGNVNLVDVGSAQIGIVAGLVKFAVVDPLSIERYLRVLNRSFAADIENRFPQFIATAFNKP